MGEDDDASADEAAGVEALGLTDEDCEVCDDVAEGSLEDDGEVSTHPNSATMHRMMLIMELRLKDASFRFLMRLTIPTMMPIKAQEPPSGFIGVIQPMIPTMRRT
ncbi:hypothetical protein [uncultured Bifidobacterium sp.]|uniref:hypothetical protein n=1 Tax=Bifidobacterium thermophilum TaxID=33905 RepID=UPI002583CBE7|nr:hypothetical protein [uncultured Bifidobacterium sp.]